MKTIEIFYDSELGSAKVKEIHIPDDTPTYLMTEILRQEEEQERTWKEKTTEPSR